MRGHTEFLHNGSLIKNGVRSAIQLDDSRTGTHFRRAYDDAIDTLICRRCDRRSRDASSASNSTIGQTTTPVCQEDLFEQRELRQEIRVNTVACLIVWP